MAQSTDGNWYGYFADRNQAERASNTAPVPGKGLNFGLFCGTGTIGGVDFGTETKGFTAARDDAAVGIGLTATASGVKIPIGALSNSCAGYAGAGANGVLE